MTLEQKCRVAGVAEHEGLIAEAVGRFTLDPDTLIALVAAEGPELVRAALANAATAAELLARFKTG